LWQNYTDDEIIKKELDSIEDSRTYALKQIEKINKNKIILDIYLKDAQDFVPPTPEHQKFKEYMIEQINITIDYDANDSYYQKDLINCDKRIVELDPIELRKNHIDYLIEDIKKSKIKYQEEINRCNDSNNWVRDLVNSINNLERTKKIKSL